MEKMLVTQALDERDLLAKKINDKIKDAFFTDTAKNNEEKGIRTRVTKEEFAKNAEAAFQQINDLIARYRKIEAAIVASNASAKIQTSYGEFTVAGAIALRERLKFRGRGSALNFEATLLEKMKTEFESNLRFAEGRNHELQGTAESMRLSILGKEAKIKDDKPLAVVETYVKENTTEIIDPLDAKKKIQEITEKQDKLLKELETQIKVSNATTMIEI